MDYIYGKLNFEVKKGEYEGTTTETATTVVTSDEISVDVLKMPNALTVIDNFDESEIVFDGGSEKEVRISSYSILKELVPAEENQAEYSLTRDGEPVGDKIIFSKTVLNVSWTDLKTLRDGSLLKPGQQYRITDFVTTTAQPDTQSAGHAFDIIVTALDESTLSEEAKAIQRDGDNYFNRRIIYVLAQGVHLFVYTPDANELQGSEYFYAWYDSAQDLYLYTLVENPVPGVDLEYVREEGIIVLAGDGITSVSHTAAKLEAWKIWYCLDNDVRRFAWADEENGKGVIYRMIDEFNNDVPYDFKNVQFLRDGVYYYTFTALENTNETIKDASIMREMATDDMADGMTYNSMKPYCIYVDDNVLLQALNFNIFKSYYDDGTAFYMPANNHFGQGCAHNFFDGTEFTRDNNFGNNCHDNNFGNGCNNNNFGNGCGYNTFGNDSYSNTFGNDCGYLKISENAGVKRYLNIDNGLQGASSVNQLELYDSAIANKEYQINFKRDADGRILMLWADDIGDTNGLYKTSNLDDTWKTIPQEIEGGTF